MCKSIQITYETMIPLECQYYIYYEGWDEFNDSLSSAVDSYGRLGIVAIKDNHSSDVAECRVWSVQCEA